MRDSIERLFVWLLRLSRKNREWLDSVQFSELTRIDAEIDRLLAERPVTGSAYTTVVWISRRG